jgi:serine/threonine-protein kinase
MKLGLKPAESSAQNGANRGYSPGDTLRSGDLLDERFAITEVLSTARDLREGQEPVVLKVPHKQVELDQNLFDRFQREETIGLRLDHPYVLKILPFHGVKSRPYIVMEHLRGVTLFHLLRNFRLFPESDALAIASLLCEALEYFHDFGVIHRDLKPENIMICFDGTIRIMDFGIAQFSESRRLTFIGFAPGTPHYMAPERVNGRRGDARTDIYGLGAILYEMLTGTIAFSHEDIDIIMGSRVTSDPVAPRKLNPKISPQAEEIVLRAMERNPARRYQSAAEFKADLDAPEKVPLTGRCHRLRPTTKWRRYLRHSRKILLWCCVPLVVQILAFFAIWHHYAKK